MCSSTFIASGAGIRIYELYFYCCTISWVSQFLDICMVQSRKMTSGTVKVSRKLPPPEQDGRTIVPQTKKRRTLEDFNTFCSLVLAYEARQEDVRQRNRSPNSLESVSSSTDSAYSEAASSPASSSGDERLLDDVDEEYSSDDESWNKITCYCQKPFAGRPMIECSECLTWIHLSCAKIRKSNVPDVFICQKCRDAKHTMRRSNRVRTQPKTKAMNFKSSNS